MKKKMEWIQLIVASCFVAFQCYTAIAGAIPGVGQRSIHLAIMTLFLGLTLIEKDEGKPVLQVLSGLVTLVCAVAVIYVYYSAVDYDLRAGNIYTYEIVLGACMIIALLYFAYRKMGPALAVIAAVFVVYAFFGKYFPSILRHSGMKLSRYIHLISFSSNGIFGSPLNAAATYIALFVLLGSVFTYTGVGDYFTQLATALFGGFRGGPAKVAVVASALFGSVSGSSIANVVGTGTFTIPMMKKMKFKPEFAGAVEAVASTGGQIMPPIMGTAAFLVAEYLEVSYWTVVKAAIIPALLYFAAVLISVDVYSVRHGIKGLSKEEMPKLKDLLKRAYLISPLVFLVICIGPLKLSINRSGTYTLLFTLLVTSISKESRINLDKLKKIVLSTAKAMISVAVACSVCGIIIGTMVGTGLSYRLSTVLVKLAGGKILVLLVLAMICGLLLGMGMPTASSYLILASLVAPSVIKLGILPMAAHMFMLYFGIISNVTPPVAMAAYAAAGIAQCNPNKCGWTAFKLALSGFILPFMFCLNNVLLGYGSWYLVIYAVITALFGIFCLSSATEGYLLKHSIKFMERAVLLGAALLCIDSNWYTDLIGIGLFAIILCSAYLRNRINQKKETAQ